MGEERGKMRTMLVEFGDEALSKDLGVREFLEDGEGCTRLDGAWVAGGLQMRKVLFVERKMNATEERVTYLC